MAFYIFHFCKADGSSPTFEVFEHPTAIAARLHGARLLEEHLSCDHISIWRGDSMIARVDRRGQPIVVELRPRAGQA